MITKEHVRVILDLVADVVEAEGDLCYESSQGDMDGYDKALEYKNNAQFALNQFLESISE
ncbi:Hypothetical protein KNT65_gp124 [Escherichia phage EcS1]|uniref:Uncharacterized protein n=1 Tax=Escherichia phage EcS1 TaxID=2083276 RepID=A0A2Z5ZCP6_9CAUD|nr:Hypothetical protein KNT65_gp124 [Escherichia phage EcS1]BBC78172.1 Hypothetical protein [Escherichia phage EcS1]